MRYELPPQWTEQWTPQGWQCPVCQHVYSPTTPMCLYCPKSRNTEPKDNTFDAELEDEK